MDDHAEQNPHLVSPSIQPIAEKALDRVVDRQAGIRRRDGHDVAGEEGRAEDDVLLWRNEANVAGGCRRIGQAVGVGV